MILVLRECEKHCPRTCQCSCLIIGISTAKARAKAKLYFLMDIAASEFFPSPLSHSLNWSWEHIGFLSSQLTALCALGRLRFRRATLIALSYSSYLEPGPVFFLTHQSLYVAMMCLSSSCRPFPCSFIYLSVAVSLLPSALPYVQHSFSSVRLCFLGYLLLIMLIPVRKLIDSACIGSPVFKVRFVLSKLLPLWLLLK